MLTIRQMEVVRAICIHGSATLAAEAMGVSQPAVSTLLRDATDAAGFALFVRRQGRLQPTMEARMLLSELELIFGGIERINRLVGDMRDFNAGSIRIAATPVLVETMLPRAISRFQARRPKVQLTVETMDNTGVVSAIARNRFDFGLVLTPIGQPEARLIELCVSDLVVVVPSGHPLGERSVVGPADLLSYPLISFSRSLPLGRLVEESFTRVGIDRRISIEVNQSSAARALVRFGAGVAIVDPFLFLDKRDHGLTSLPFEPRTQVKAQILVPTNTRLTRPAQYLVALLREMGRTLGSKSSEPVSVDVPA